MAEANLLKDTIVPICAVLGAVIGLYNLVVSILKDRRASIKAGSETTQRDDDDLRFMQFQNQQKLSSTNVVAFPVLGTEEYEWAERELKRGRLVRAGRDGYGLPRP